MKITPEILDEMYRAGYRAPDENKLVCAKCPAVARNAGSASRYYCRRHGFYVHSSGYCPMCGHPLAGSAPSPYKQDVLFK